MISRMEITPLAVLHACNVDTTLMVVIQQAGVWWEGCKPLESQRLKIRGSLHPSNENQSLSSVIVLAY